MSFVVRYTGTFAALEPALRREVQAVDPGQAVTRIESLDTLVAAAVARQRFAMTLCTVYSGVALLLAAIGVYGVMSCAVAQRARELGVRLALGALPADVVRLVLASGLRLIGIGLVVGVSAALAASRLVEALLFQTSSRDPVVLAVIANGLAAAALIACLVPALRAARIDPMVALRAE
jgi:ABC-type antimicrobial peptide transport system permease subunit